MSSMLVRVGVLAAAVMLAGTIAVPVATSSVLEGHRSSLHARVTMTDGTRHRILLQGVGCTQNLCSRVRVRDATTDRVWLDRLASVRDISPNEDGPVHVVFTFKDGSSRETSVSASNRVLYVGNRFWTHQLDLTDVRQIDFE